MAQAAEPPTDPLPQTIFSPDHLVKRGWCTVARDKQCAPAPHKLYYELHGEDKPTSHRLVFTMGLNNSSFAWHNQVSYFATLPGYAVLVFDNRGVGWSDTPPGAYSTSEMAKDVEELLDFVEWTEPRSLNLAGVSMGGMIAQELALLIPERIRTLLLTSTMSGSRFTLPSWKAASMFLRLSSGTVRTPAAQISLVTATLFPEAYLETEVHEEGEYKGKKRREQVQADFLRRYHIGRRQSARGQLGQMAAVMKHRVSADRLAKLASAVPHTAIIHGTDDNLIHVQRAHELHKDIPGSRLKIVENAGHALPSQIRDEYNAWIRENVEREE
ncbi:Alpha/Beta hydrolase protein [Rhodotorula diobovata]|uniref:Alpha/Beta hydrolase protein n=1 Tax=Rhodotorula diobovata TaxID=5288 RepID=A0A5C5FZG2_9BASI|nr:Alpha/Beta hydrolase protein [Rhodotorula diobovata]